MRFILRSATRLWVTIRARCSCWQKAWSLWTLSRAALALDTQEPFDVLVTDVSLPGMSGTDLARHVLAKDPERWVVLCSGYHFGAALASLGPHVRALVKPFELEDLDALLAEISTALKTSPAV